MGRIDSQLQKPKSKTEFWNIWSEKLVIQNLRRLHFHKRKLKKY